MKKRLLIAMITLFSLAVVAGCENSSDKATSQEQKENARMKEKKIDDYTFVLIDKQTKIQYLKVVRNSSYDGGLDVTALYQANGKPYVGEEVRKGRFSTQKIDDYTFIITDEETKVQYLKLVRNSSYDGGIVIKPLLNPEGGFLTTP